MAKGLRIAIVTDLEGVACVTGRYVWDSSDATGAFAEATQLLVGEINAAAQAAFAAGAEEVLVVEGHANSFRTHLEEFDRRARLALGVPFQDTPQGRYDALMLVGYHAMADTELGVLSHSWADKAYVASWLNGTLIGEIGHQAAMFGEYGTPLVFVSGDLAACREAENLVDGVVTAPVKDGAGRFGAYSLSPEAARSLIRERVHKALETRARVQPLRFAPPVEFIVEFSTADSVERNTMVPGITSDGPRRMVIRGASVYEVMTLFALTGRIV